MIGGYRDAPEPALRESVARALFNKGLVLWELGGKEEVIACYDEVDARYRDAPEPGPREIVQAAIKLREMLRGGGNS
ncbi:hypothetical protein SAMN05216404_1168 [Nitrosospira multiformis]|uniref:Tetratricopeptide repeat protein n=1 Tax=Nitrosospira multiformis TaxID=1231 RepID=A0A1H8NE87_9PROT|nr:hypothetical protein [Nitrosospira multiformis]SEO27743.1 hypothetical protein SAMN05216404_1168 [Nitrosospira multiformis]